MENLKLVDKAKEATKNSYSPYSKFKVGAALLLKDGNVITGANIENASFGLTICAERAALFAAYSKGYRKEDIEALAIAADTDDVVSPCGACRQVISELISRDSKIILSNFNNKIEILTIDKLLPYYFKADDMS